MRYRIRHLTRYTFSEPVFLEPHVIRLHPRMDPKLNLLSYDLRLDPEPIGLSAGLDAENNPFHLAWFGALTDHLEIISEYSLETLRTNPFSAYLTSGDSFPVGLSPNEQAALAPSMAPLPTMTREDSQVIAELSDSLVSRSKNNVLLFFDSLNQLLHDRIRKVLREEPGIQSVSKTLESGSGACRDLAVLFLSAARHVGVPARFVSGCQEGDPRLPEGELHAWAEIYLPGFGWIGFDPTHGLAVADRHIPYSASALPDNSSPVTGTFRTSNAQSLLSHRIQMESD